MGDRDSRLVRDDASAGGVAARRAAAPGRPRSVQAAVVALQHAAGNAAVVRTLRQSPAQGTVLARSPLKANIDAFKDAADHWRHDDILKILLDLDTDDERRQALNTLSLSKLDALSYHLRRHPPPGRNIGAILLLVAQALTTTWEHDYAAAVAASDWGPAAMLLSQLDDDAALVTKARQIANKGPMPLDVAIATAIRWLDPEDRVVRALRYLRNEPLIGSVGRGETAVTNRDHAAETINVAGGKVTTYDRIDILNTKDGGGIKYDVKSYGFEYEGADARNTDWLLFFAPEAQRYDAKGQSLGFETDVQSQFRGKNRLTPWGTTQNPRWTLDGEGDVAPFYEAANTQTHDSGAHTTTDKQTAMFDHPTVDKAVVKAAFAEDDTAQVVVRMRFHAYLVRGIQVLYENDLTVQWTLSSPSDDPERTRDNLPGKGRTATALSREHHDALVDKFPIWSVYPTK